MRLRVLVLMIFSFAALRMASSAQAKVTSLNTNVFYIFGESVYFKAIVKSNDPVKAAVIFFQADADTHTNVGLAQVKDLGNRQFELTYLHHIPDYSFRPFSIIHFHWELTMESQEVYASTDEEFNYLDNRFKWELLSEGKFHVHWYEGDIPFAQEVLDIAQKGKDHIQSLLPMPEPESFEIYIYPDSQTLQEALQPDSESWIAGHADPDLGVILVALPDIPEQRLLAEQRIPHEIMHILLYQYSRLGYQNLPIWLKEGLASLAELYPNSDYQILLGEAAGKGELIPISSLCDAFPREASNALLSYAQAQSFTKYLHSSYGSSGLESLIIAYANGLNCDQGPQQVFGKNLKQLERGWQTEVLAQNVLLKAFLNLLPWVIILIIVLSPFLFFILLRTRTTRTDQEKAKG